MSTSWAIGFAVGILLVAVVSACFAKAARRSGRKQGEFDERQQVARGKAFTAAYATLLLYLCFWMIMRSLEVPFFMESLSVIAGALLSIAVFVGHSIFHDAYFKASESPRTWIGILCAVGTLNLVIGILHLMRGTDLQTRLYDNMNLPVGLLMLVTLACVVIKRLMDRRAEED